MEVLGAMDQPDENYYSIDTVQAVLGRYLGPQVRAFFNLGFAPFSVETPAAPDQHPTLRLVAGRGLGHYSYYGLPFVLTIDDPYFETITRPV
jgi:hypothetical protein